MTRITIMLAALIIMIGSASCRKSFLDTPPTTTAEQSTFITNLSAVQQLLTGAYVTAAGYYYYNVDPVYADIVGDNIKLTGLDTYYQSAYSWAQVASRTSSDDNNSNIIWGNGYMLIRTLGFVTDNIDKFSNEDPGKAAEIKGEALAFRALLHFDLLNHFAQPFKFSPDASHPGIPYITTADKNAPIKRSTVAENYSLIIDDLTTAIGLLAVDGDMFHIGRNAAMGILSRVYLYKGDYAMAKQYAVEVAKAVPIMTTGYPANLFTPNDNEGVFYLMPLPQYGSAFPAVYYSDDAYGALFEATGDITNALRASPTDTRNAWVTDNGSINQITKFPVGVVAGVSTPQGAYYLPLLRSSEMYLTAAECFANTNMPDSAIYYLDKVRKRADAAATATTASGQQLMDAILLERQKELSFEGHRYFDLMRLGLGVHRIDATDPQAQTLPYKDPRAVAPIPVLEVEQYGIKQNDGY